MLPISGLGEEEACYIAVISEERKHVTFQWSPRRGNMLPISETCYLSLRGEETCYLSVVSEKRKHVAVSLRRGNMLPFSGLRGEETCYLLVVSEKRKHVTY